MTTIMQRLAGGSLAAGMATLVLGATMAPRVALAQSYDDGRCGRDTATGAVVGGALGATAGASLSGHGSKTGGAVVGGLLGAAVGAGVGNNAGCDRSAPAGYATGPEGAYPAQAYDQGGYPPPPPSYDGQGYGTPPQAYDQPSADPRYGYAQPPSQQGYGDPRYTDPRYGDPQSAYGDDQQAYDPRAADGQAGPPAGYGDPRYAQPGYGPSAYDGQADDQRADEQRFYQRPGAAMQGEDDQPPSPYAGYRP